MLWMYCFDVNKSWLIDWLIDGAIRWSKKFSDTFSRFDTIPAVTDSQPATQPASHVAVAIALNAKASSLKITEWPRTKG